MGGRDPCTADGSATETAGITAALGTHAGRRTVVTALFVESGEAHEDIARFVGHTKPSTTAGYVERLGRRLKLLLDGLQTFSMP